MEIDLDMPFNYNNNENLMIVVNGKTGATDYSSSYYSSLSPEHADMSIYATDYQQIDPANPGSAERSVFRPDTRM